MTNSILEKFIVREFVEKDRSYICKTILFGHWELDRPTRRINKDSYLTNQNKIINHILDKAKCLIIVDPEEQNLLYGFIIFETRGEFDIIHYAYTRADFRKIGLLENLLEVVKKKNQLVLTHINDEIKPARLKKYYDKVIVDPYLLYEGLK